jgi:class 3 adenylate cyclase
MAEQRIQRRLAAVMAADMVGYSRMTSTDEARTLVRLRLLREEVFVPEIRAHGGRLVKEMGDGLLAEFNSTVDALECAVAVQRAIEGHERAAEQEDPIRYRVGINLGDIVIEGDDILGDGVNIAARLESLAEPGGIVVSSAVFDQARGKLDFAYEHLGERNLKNISEPVRIYRVFPSGRPDTLELSVRERQFRESVRDRFADDVAYYVPLLGRTTEAGTEKKTRALRSVCRRKRRAEFEYHEWIAVGEDVKQVKIDSLSDAVE